MQTIGYHGAAPIPEIRIKRPIDISSIDFDGTDTANMVATAKTTEANGSKFNPWQKGFLIQAPSTDGIVYALLFEDYVRYGNVVNDALKQPVYVTAGQWASERVVKVYTADKTTDDTIYIGI